KQHIAAIRKPLLTKKQAEQMAAFDQKVKQAQPTPTPIIIIKGAKPIPIPKPTPISVPLVQAPPQAPPAVDAGTTAPPAGAAPSGSATNSAASQPLSAPVVQGFMTPTPSTQLVPVEVQQDSPNSEMGVIPK
ncbi:MAG TPA: hypothetical protein VIJ93_14485, partial [bacterium]